MHVGQHGIYRVTEGQLTQTVKGSREMIGSVHHPEMTEFFGVVGRVHAAVEAQDATDEAPAAAAQPERATIGLMVPNKRDIVWVDGVIEGDGPGQFDPEGVPAPRGKR